MEKFLQLSLSRLGVIFLISAVFLSIPQHEVLTKYNLSVACSETVTATYPNLTFSTYLGGDTGGEKGRGIAVTDNGNYYVTGQTKSSDFPTLNAYDNTNNGSSDAIIAKFSPNASLLWSTYFGGNDTDICRDIAVAADGSCYVTGETQSTDFPTKNAYDSTFNGGYTDVFIAKFAANGSLLWSSYLGGGGGWDIGYSIAIAADGSCYVTGETASDNFPTLHAYDDSKASGYDIFIMKFSSTGSLLWSTYLGGNQTDIGYSIAATNDGSCYIIGKTWSADFPTLNAYDNTLGATSDSFITKFVDTLLPSTPSIPPTHHRAYYGFLAFIIIIPIIVIIFSKKRK